jgi:hypothetical protein
MRDSEAPIEYLVTSSQTSLEAFELARLNRCANLRKELREVLEEWLQMEVDARLARWILECRRAQNGCSDSLAAPRIESSVAQLALSFLPEPPGSQREAMARRISELPPETSRNVREPCASASPEPRDCCQQVKSAVNSTVNSPIQSKDAAASLRLLEQFLGYPAQPIDTPEQNPRFGTSGIETPPASAISREDNSPRRGGGAVGGAFSTRVAASPRRQLHAAPRVGPVVGLVARHNR